VIRTPRCFAQRMMSTLPAVETWQMCRPRADVAGEQRVAGDDRLLGDRRPPGQPEPGRRLALVQLRPDR
jgi:hypothetical protein